MKIQKIVYVAAITFLFAGTEANGTDLVLRIDNKTNKNYAIYDLSNYPEEPTILDRIKPNEKNHTLNFGLYRQETTQFNIGFKDPQTDRFVLYLQAFRHLPHQIQAADNLGSFEVNLGFWNLAGITEEGTSEEIKFNPASRDSYLIQLTLEGEKLKGSDIEVTGIER